MVTPEPDEMIRVPVPGGELAVARWGDGPVPVIAAHGITSSSAAWRAVARHVDRASTTLWAPDLRGRGASATVGSPYGVDRHADHLLAVAAHVGAERFVLIGHSQGTFMLSKLAAEEIDDGSAANLGTMERTRVIDCAREVLRYTGHDAEIELHPEMPTGPLNRVAENSLARMLMGWEPEMKFMDGLHRTIDWYFGSRQREAVSGYLDRMLTER